MNTAATVCCSFRCSTNLMSQQKLHATKLSSDTSTNDSTGLTDAQSFHPQIKTDGARSPPKSSSKSDLKNKIQF